MTMPVDNNEVPADVRPLWWHLQNKQFTASGYGKRIPTEYVVRLNNRWRRVYCCVFSNSGTCYVEGGKDESGKRKWLIVERSANVSAS